MNSIFLSLEERFSDYLNAYDKQWETEETITKWRSLIANCRSLKNFVTSIQILNDRFKNPYKIRENDEDDEEEALSSMQLRILNSEPHYTLNEEKDHNLEGLLILKHNKSLVSAARGKNVPLRI